MPYFGGFSADPETIAEMAKLARSAYADGGEPGDDWTRVRGDDVGFVSGVLSGSFGDYFEAGLGFLGLPAAAVFKKGTI